MIKFLFKATNHTWEKKIVPGSNIYMYIQSEEKKHILIVWDNVRNGSQVLLVKDCVMLASHGYHVHNMSDL